ncbi:hypothetical protein GUJ93_ZPchr0205g6538 [Zizania palustris]|uniref:Uncharacterized protein n=1 Tax=Zizania palustris TaxID=103762 RepID=A0A8J5RD82_ZIZPA|nr:hypothetical protein GUJ93_ZPchr0205g6538 [Zizania palustris]
MMSKKFINSSNNNIPNCIMLPALSTNTIFQQEPEGNDEDEHNFDVGKGPSRLAWTEDDNMRLELRPQGVKGAKAKEKGKLKVPSVAAFTSRFKNLTADAQLALLLYHDVKKHYSENALKTINGEVNTLATDGTKSFDLTIKNQGDAMRGGSGGKEVGGKGRGLINGRRCAGKQQRWAKLLLLLPGAGRGIWRRRKKRGGAESDAILAERHRTLCATAG